MVVNVKKHEMIIEYFGKKIKDKRKTYTFLPRANCRIERWFANEKSLLDFLFPMLQLSESIITFLHLN